MCTDQKLKKENVCMFPHGGTGRQTDRQTYLKLYAPDHSTWQHKC